MANMKSINTASLQEEKQLVEILQEGMRLQVMKKQKRQLQEEFEGIFDWFRLIRPLELQMCFLDDFKAI